ncbi:unnamed protein product [Urochloa humidicola]
MSGRGKGGKGLGGEGGKLEHCGLGIGGAEALGAGPGGGAADGAGPSAGALRRGAPRIWPSRGQLLAILPTSAGAGHDIADRAATRPDHDP